MRVLQVIPFFSLSRGGLVAGTCSLSRELVRRGFEVEVLTTDFELDEGLKHNVDEMRESSGMDGG